MEERCPHCNALMKMYWHRITPGLTKVLAKIYAKVCEKGENNFRMDELKLDHSEYGNFQKLRFHALIAKEVDDGELIKGSWLITRRGVNYLKNIESIPVRVQTFRNKVVDHDSELVNLSEVMRKTDPYFEVKFDYDIFEPHQKLLL